MIEKTLFISISVTLCPLYLFIEFLIHSHDLSIHNPADNGIVRAVTKFGVLINRALTPDPAVRAI